MRTKHSSQYKTPCLQNAEANAQDKNAQEALASVVVEDILRSAPCAPGLGNQADLASYLRSGLGAVPPLRRIDFSPDEVKQALAMLTRAVVRDGLPTSLLEGDSAMRDFFVFITGGARSSGEVGQASENVSSRGLGATDHKTFNRYIEAAYMAHCEAFKKAVESHRQLFALPFISTLTDEWTGCDNEQYLGIAVRMLNPRTLVPESQFLNLALIETAADAENLTTLMREALVNSLGIVEDDICKYVVGGSTDNASTAVLLVHNVTNVAMRCLGHTLNLVMQDAVGESGSAGLDGDALIRQRDEPVSDSKAIISDAAAFLQKINIICTHFGRSPKAQNQLDDFSVKTSLRASLFPARPLRAGVAIMRT